MEKRIQKNIRRLWGSTLCLKMIVFLLTAAILSGCGEKRETVFEIQENFSGDSEGTSVREGSHSDDAEAERNAEGSEEQERETDTAAVREAAGADEEKRTFFVHVTGAVKHPGVYELEEGSRIIDAAEAAGGFTPDADLVLVNQAAEITDGMQIYFPTESEAADCETDSGGFVTDTADVRFVSGGSGGQPDGTEKININTADEDALMTLNGIGKAKAEAIIAYREEHGGFRSIEEIREVNGIKDSVFERIRESITVE